MTPLHLLIERVQAASEGSRELDAEINLTLDVLPSWVRNLGSRKIIQGDDGQPLVHWRGVSCSLRATNWEALPYSTSIDAALALVGEKLPGWGCGMLNHPNGQNPSFDGDWAQACVGEHGAGGTWFMAKTPPLAIIAALLSALSSLGGDEG